MAQLKLIVTGQLFPPLTCNPTHGKRLAQCGDCKILRRYSVLPSPQLYRCLLEKHHAPAHRRRKHSVWLTLQLVGQGDGINYPVGQSLLGDSLTFLLTSVADKELLRASEAPGEVHVYAQRSYESAVRSVVLADRNLSLTESSGSK